MASIQSIHGQLTTMSKALLRSNRPHSLYLLAKPATNSASFKTAKDPSGALPEPAEDVMIAAMIALLSELPE